MRIKNILKKVVKKIPFWMYILLRSITRMCVSIRLFLIKKIIINKKWKQDRIASERLSNNHKKLYFSFQSFYYKKFKKTANIITPMDYNEKIQWLKLFDQEMFQVSCTDKYLVREYVKKTIGEKYLNVLFGVYNSYNEIDITGLPVSFVLKTNHNSGMVFLIKDKSMADWKMIRNRINDALAHPYGTNSGEWPYQLIKRKILVEKYLDPDSETPPADFKFHCIEGKVKWLQYIFDRGVNTKEIHFDKNFERIPLHLDWDFPLSNKIIRKPNNWNELINVAERLAAPFKYIRVDLYNINENIIFGELTFFPKGGFYPSSDITEFGKLMDFDLASVKEPVF